MHLRMCMTCGKIGCCDSSPNRHASRHAREEGHPIARSAEPGEDWSWCFVDEVAFVVEPGRGAMSAAVDTPARLPALPLEEWEATKDTLHLWAQIVGKVRMASAAPRNHWWHVPLYVDVRGLTTRRMHSPHGVTFQIDFDFVDHRLVVRTNRGRGRVVRARRRALGRRVRREPARDPAPARDRRRDSRAAVRRADDDAVPRGRSEHASYDRDAVERFWRILDWTDGVFEEFAGWYCGKTSPVHLFWHWLRPRAHPLRRQRAPSLPDRTRSTARPTRTRSSPSGSGPATRACASRRTTRTPLPSPRACVSSRFARRRPAGSSYGGGSLAVLPYEAVRTAARPEDDAARVPRERLSSRRDARRLGSSRAGVGLVSRPGRAERPARRPSASIVTRSTARSARPSTPRMTRARSG